MLMNSGGGVFRCSMRSDVFIFLLSLLIFFIFLCCMVFVLNLEAWNENRTLLESQYELELRADQNAAEIERLSVALKNAHTRLEELSSRNGADSTVDNIPVGLGDPIDKRIVRLENVTCRLLDPKALRIALELYVIRAKTAINGRVLFSLRDAEGSIYPLIYEDSSFNIIRFRKIVMKAELPGVPVDLTGAGVMVEVLSGGEVVYCNVYPLQN